MSRGHSGRRSGPKRCCMVTSSVLPVVPSRLRAAAVDARRAETSAPADRRSAKPLISVRSLTPGDVSTPLETSTPQRAGCGQGLPARCRDRCRRPRETGMPPAASRAKAQGNGVPVPPNRPARWYRTARSPLASPAAATTAAQLRPRPVPAAGTGMAWMTTTCGRPVARERHVTARALRGSEPRATARRRGRRPRRPRRSRRRLCRRTRPRSAAADAPRAVARRAGLRHSTRAPRLRRR